MAETINSGIRILIADDDPAILKSLHMYLSGRGHEVLLAADGREALEVIGRQRPDMVLTDNMMPRMTGLELLEEIRSSSDIPVVLFTGFAEMKLAVEALNKGAHYFIRKPVNLAEIETVISRLRESMELRRTLEEQRARLLQLTRMSDLGELVAGVIHEVDRPVSAMAAGLEAMRRDMATVRGYFDNAQNGVDPVVDTALCSLSESIELQERACDRISAVTGAMSDFAVRGHDNEYCVEDPDEAVLETLSIFEHAEKVRFDISLAASCACRISRLGLTQLLAALVTNAVEACEDGRNPEVSVSSRLEGGYLVVRVGDNGPGVEPEGAEMVFTPFYTTKNKDEHKGLGLSRAFGIVSAAGGDISCDNSATGGAVFEVRLPAVPVEDNHAGCLAEKAPGNRAANRER